MRNDIVKITVIVLGYAVATCAIRSGERGSVPDLHIGQLCIYELESAEDNVFQAKHRNDTRKHSVMLEALGTLHLANAMFAAARQNEYQNLT